jgi:cell division protein FtsN
VNRVGLWFGVIGLFVLVTVASFCVGKYVLGDKLLNKPQIQVQHYPYESGDEGSIAAKFAKENPFSGVRSPKRDTRPRVVIEVQPPSAGQSETEESSLPDESNARESENTREEPQALAQSERGRNRETTKIHIAVTPQPSSTPVSQSAPARAHGTTPSPVVAPERVSPPDRGKPKVPPPVPDRRHRVQVGLFSVRDNANALITELQHQGFHATTMAAENQEGKTFYRVQLGPFKDKESAARVKQQLSDLGFDGSFVPQ